MTATFADTFYYLALLNPRDQSHGAAVAIGASLSGGLVTTRAVLIEVADALASPAERPKFLALLAALEASPEVTIVPVGDDLFRRAVALYGARSDKGWSLTDCISFVVMQDGEIVNALTADRHFSQAGFRPMLAS
jgi:predicted nucleic acid-binding protein